MRRIFQFDGLDKGVLSVGECSQADQVALCISRDAQEIQVLLGRADFKKLAELQWTLRFTSEETRLEAVQ